MQNPLLDLAASGELPAFDRIQPGHAEPAIDALLAQNRAALAARLADAAPPTWENLAEPLEELGDRLARVWSAMQRSKNP